MTRNRVALLAAAPFVLAGLVAGGTWLYLHVVEGKAPDELALTAPSTSASPGPAVALDGTWTASHESVVGYRVKEVLFGQHQTAVGRTSQVTGSLTVAGTTVRGT